MATVRERVREHLQGFRDRQVERDAARQIRNQCNAVRKSIAAGALLRRDGACPILDGLGIVYGQETVFGVTLMSLSCGIRLAYRPDGVLDRATRGKKSGFTDSRQESLF